MVKLKALPTKKPVRVYQQSCRTQEEKPRLLLVLKNIGSELSSLGHHAIAKLETMMTQGTTLECRDQHWALCPKSSEGIYSISMPQVGIGLGAWDGLNLWEEKSVSQAREGGKGRGRKKQWAEIKKKKKNTHTWDTASSNSAAHICPANSHEPDKLNLK